MSKTDLTRGSLPFLQPSNHILRPSARSRPAEDASEVRQLGFFRLKDMKHLKNSRRSTYAEVGGATYASALARDQMHIIL